MRGLANLTAALRALADRRVLVGVPSDSRPHEEVGTAGKNARDDARGPMNNATLLYIHTNGAPEVNLPARPSLKPGVERNRANIVTRLKAAGKAATEGNLGAVDRYLHAIGIETVSAVRQVIQDGIPPPLKPATVAARRRRSKGSSYRRKAVSPSDTTPLIDTAQMINAIAYAIRDENK